MPVAAVAPIFRAMSAPEELHRRWLDDEAEARRLDELRAEARRSCDAALDRAREGGGHAGSDVARELDALERSLEGSLAFYLRHTANDAGFLRGAFGPDRARELGHRLSQRKLSLLTELDRVRELRARLEKNRPGREGPGGGNRAG